MTGDQVLRAMGVRALEGCSFEDLAFHLADSASYRHFCRVGWGEVAPAASTLQENIRRVKPESWVEAHRILRHAVAIGVKAGIKTRIDCTVTTSNIHPPDDGSQLYDVVRVLTRLLRKAEKLRPGVAVKNRTKRAKRRQLETLTSEKPEREAAYRDLVKVTKQVLAWSSLAIEALRNLGEAGSVPHLLAAKIEHVAALGARVVDQTVRRVFKKESVPQQAAMDGGFASKEGLRLAKAKGVKEVCFSNRRGMEVSAMASTEQFHRSLWRFRAGVEANISWLKRALGLRRTAWKGKSGFHAYVHSNVAAFNLLLLARLTAD
jgi:IS5 family transposase